ncbi:MAG: hypothetical protein NT164_06330 [Verrucomicrobiae bacterium]|nr:hypothetical protein [Verrucomicrobiae bacterium]
MQFIPPLSAILLLIGTTFSLQAIPMFGEGEGRAGQKSALVAEKEEAAGRRISESSSAGGASMNEGHYFSRQNGPKKIQSSSMERTSISSGTAGAATDSTVLPSTEEQDPHASEPAATTGDSFQGHSVAAVEPKPLYRLAPEGWQEMSGTEGWQSTDHFDNTTATFMRSSALRHPVDLKPFDVVSQSYSRFETIDKRKAACSCQQGHEIEIASSNPRPTINASAASGHVEASEESQVSMTPEQAIQDLALSAEEADKVARVLGNIFKLAPTMECLRVLDFSEGHDETTKLFEANQGVYLSEKKLILNNGEPPVRLAVPMPGNADAWTSVVPSIIPAGIKTRFPDERGKWIEMEAPNREPTSEERRQVRSLIQNALGSHYGSSEAERMLSLSEGAMTLKNVGGMMATKPETNTNTLVNFVTIQGDQSSLQQARQELTSPYVPLLEGLSAAAECVARGVGAVAGTAGLSLVGFLDGAMEGGEAVEKALDKAPLIISTGPIAAVPVLAGIFVGGVTGPIRALPQAARTSFGYFSPQQAWKKSMAALSRWGDSGHAIGLLEKANEADEKIKTDLNAFFEPALSTAKCNT